MKDPDLAVSSRIVPVPLAENRGYEIHIGSGLLHGIGTSVLQTTGSRKAIIISQPAVARLWATPLVSSLRAAGFGEVPILTFPDGERHKTLQAVSRIYEKLYLSEPPIDRSTLIFALGGGVVGDVAGFVAASYLRGLSYIQIPTTLLAMVDSSVGGKTGVDFKAGKNLIGAFHQPRSVYIDTDTLETLPTREFCAGMGEVIKYGVIADPNLLTTVTMRSSEFSTSHSRVLTSVIARCCEIKAGVVVQDEFERTGVRATLNFGHTIGHALESVTEYKRFKHGEAIAIGMVAAANIGEICGITPPSVRKALTDALIAHHLPLSIPRDIAPDSILALLGRDKKALAGKARFVLASGLGSASLVSDIDEVVVRDALKKTYVSELE